MQIIDLAKEHEASYFLCLEEWSDEVKEAGPHREAWYRKMRERGLRAKLAVDEKGMAGGMIQYLPAEHSTIDGPGLYFIPCIWVHGHKQGRGNFQKHGMGTALLAAAEEDARNRGANGMAAWGLWLPIWMRASWYKKHGYRTADRNGIMALVWKPFTDDAKQPRWIRKVKKPGTVPGQVSVAAFLGGWCVNYNLAYERAKRAAAEFGDKVAFQTIDTSDRKNFQEWGMSDALFIDGREVNVGPAPSYAKLRSMIEKRVKTLR